MNEQTTARRPSRREFLALGAGIFTVSALGGVTLGRRRVVRRTVPVMGTLAEIVVVSRDERGAHGAINAAIAELYDVERRMTRFTATSDIGRANGAAFTGPVAISAATAAVVAEGLRWAGINGSRFDPCLGLATEIWDVTRRSEPPAPGDVRRLAGRALHRAVELDRSGGRDAVRFHAPDIALDLGGIAKGHAVDRAVAALREWGVTDGLVNAGGDLYALGRSGEGDPWRVGIRSPADPGSLAATIELEDRAVATSGDYEQYFDHDGRRYHHLIDPATAAPRLVDAHSVTVAANSCMTADAAATAVFGLQQVAAARVLARGDAAGAVLLLA